MKHINTWPNDKKQLRVDNKTIIENCQPIVSSDHDTLLQLVFNVENARIAGRMQRVTQQIADTLEKQLRLKFGELPSATVQRLHQASEAELDLWSERILFVASIEEVFA